MNSNAQSLIQLYNTCFLICLILGLLALGLGVFFFFKFDIRTNLAIRTGHAEKASVRKTKSRQNKTDSLTAQQPQVNMDYSTDEFRTGEISADSGASETTALGGQEPSAGETVPLWSPAEAEAAQRIGFIITENTVVIHTTEII